jgi:predicted ester cyclase
MAQDKILEQLRRPVSDEGYAAVRDTWKRHSMAEDARDLAGLMSTLTDDCVYELVQTGHRWEGHAGATAFYMELLGAFPDVVFDLTDIVIGPQGVCEMADVTATHRGSWLGNAPTGRAMRWKVVIFFPWDPAAGLFTGEKVWSHSDDLETLAILAGTQSVRK